MPKLSIVIPAYNEARRLPRALAELTLFCAGLPAEHEVLIVVEPGSDSTLEIAAAHAARHPAFAIIANEVHRGKGHAVRTGMLRAQGELIFYMDADLSVPLREIIAFLDFFASHPEFHLLIGNRAHARSRITRRQSWLRQMMGQTFNGILQRLELASLHDTQCGFKAFRREAAREIFRRQTLDGFAFDVEVLLLAERLGYGIADLPVEWINSDDSRVHIVRDSVAMLSDALRVRRIVENSIRRMPLASPKR